MYSSRTVKCVFAPSGTTANVRTPLKRPSGIPPLQVMVRGGSNAVTLTGKARPGLASETTSTFSPGAIVPFTRSTPESHSA